MISSVTAGVRKSNTEHQKFFLTTPPRSEVEKVIATGGFSKQY